MNVPLTSKLGFGKVCNVLVIIESSFRRPYDWTVLCHCIYSSDTCLPVPGISLEFLP